MRAFRKNKTRRGRKKDADETQQGERGVRGRGGLVEHEENVKNVLPRKGNELHQNTFPIKKYGGSNRSDHVARRHKIKGGGGGQENPDPPRGTECTIPLKVNEGFADPSS